MITSQLDYSAGRSVDFTEDGECVDRQWIATLDDESFLCKKFL